MTVLRQAEGLENGSGYIFPSPAKTNTQLSCRTLQRQFKDAGVEQPATVHGLRASFKDWTRETEKSSAVAEQALAHVVKGVEGDYVRGDLLQPRRRLMQQWSDYLTRRHADKVVHPRFGRA